MQNNFCWRRKIDGKLQWNLVSFDGCKISNKRWYQKAAYIIEHFLRKAAIYLKKYATPSVSQIKIILDLGMPFIIFLTGLKLGGGWPTKWGGGGDFCQSVTLFSAPKAPKNGNFWKFLGIIGLSDTFLAPQEPKILKNFGILAKNHPNLWKLKILLHNYA